jgi:hypothetical protein
MNGHHPGVPAILTSMMGARIALRFLPSESLDCPTWGQNAEVYWGFATALPGSILKLDIAAQPGRFSTHFV